MLLFRNSLIIFICSAFTLNLMADEFHYKDMLIGGRAATMGGAYTAISDDATGTYYNPAGLALIQGDSISGSAKIFNDSLTTYDQVIGKNDWVRKNNNLLANFFGIVKKMKNHVFAFSMAIEDASIEYQDQVYRDITGLSVDIDLYLFNLHQEDTTDLFSLSYATELGDSFSVGLTTSYHKRQARLNIHSLIEYKDSTEESHYSNTAIIEHGIRPKLGFLWYPTQKLSFGLALSSTFLFSNQKESQFNDQAVGSDNNEFKEISTALSKTFPIVSNLGIAYFASPFLLFSFDFDFHYSLLNSVEDVMNFSLGSEYYLNQKNAIRVGVYTNNSNVKAVSAATLGLTHLDLYGVTLGYTNYSKDSSITFGVVYSQGEGKTQPYNKLNAIRDISKRSITIITSADYGF